MKRLVLAVAVLALLAAPAAHAQGPMGGLGFRAGSSPFSALPIGPVETSPTVGVRHWLNAQYAMDLAVGYNQFKIEPSPETWTGFVFDIGVPISIKKVSDKVNFILRPGFQYGTLEDKDESLVPTLTTKFTTMAVTGELEVEWMVTEGLSVSASHGIAWHQLEDDGTPKTTVTSFGTVGNNFTSLGFHVYLW